MNARTSMGCYGMVEGNASEKIRKQKTEDGRRTRGNIKPRLTASGQARNIEL